MRNKDIREAARVNNVKLWQIADVLKISEPTMTRKLRHELSDEEKAKIYAIIEELAANN